VKLSLRWLKELVPGSEPVAALDGSGAAQALTTLGLEVENVEEKGRTLRGVLVAEVLATRPHPAADKLRLVRIRAGSREEEVVCGAGNVPGPGGRVAWASPGAHLPGNRLIEAREVRGVLSPGMLCSETELGISQPGDGILILSPSDPSGADFAERFGVTDDILEVNVTPNRPDALSHLGIARELAAFHGVRARPPIPDRGNRAGSGPSRDVHIADESACARYQARFGTGLHVAESPFTIRLRLGYCGVRPISNLVDVTNYVLLELGHPLHAFDLEKVRGTIVVRRARPGEGMTTLDGTARTLEPDDIVITDESGPVALAGVMGGAGTEVSASTRQVLLEAATFDPRSIRRTSRRLGLISEASHRFERGVDPEGIPLAAERAASLMALLGGGTVVDQVVDRHPRPAARRNVELTVVHLRRVSGLPLEAEAAARELAKVADFKDDGAADEAVQVVGIGTAAKVVMTVPSYRTDLVLPEDLIEEVLRLGRHYESPAPTLQVLANANPGPNPENPAHRVRDVLAACGLSEIVTWGFVPRAALAAMAGKRPELADGVAVKNPISADYEVMRTCLLPGLAGVMTRNLSRGIDDVRLFEVGPVIQKRRDAGGAAAQGTPRDVGAGWTGNEPQQLERAGVLLTGRRGDWLKPGDPLDFFDLKQAVVAVCGSFGIDPAFVPTRDFPFLHPGVAASVEVEEKGGAGKRNGKHIGWAGELHPMTARRLGLERRTFFAELDVDSLCAAALPVRSVAPPRFPAVTRDLSFWIDLAVPAADQRAAFCSAGEPLLADVQVREDFRDPRYVPPGKKGMLWGMTYRAEDRTLTDAEADTARVAIAVR
jgi:phenylalanyl-tRNA synthetase beta chain